ncbi:hypothetical protein RIF25_05635 [Thermosynechococcaceae cyanobacterium BACA0444]|uniref:Abortive infection protein-like C-terminal domain-containing protein n=1 Tax=Pseudocalidococcus azoricus BACA0444 TaxID=2918990 RepID=A0AAE4FQ77_9CYAN|nr:hypothetical protein [Pseudocalidococcus azoricus]MDS3860284.1 hypothetical protein [Pseudocalidococcus azoricus BACA0444]
MPLKYPSSWRFSRSKDVIISDPAISEFFDLVGKIAAQGDRWWFFERFKGFFASAAGSTSYRSSSESWAETDLLAFMRQLATNPPLFLEAFYDACQSFQNTQYDTPDVELINDICREYQIGYQIAPPELRKLDIAQEVISIPNTPSTFSESSVQLLQESLNRAEQLLSEKRPREAVQEMLWILESISTVFKGIPLASGTIKGKYFNEITKELRKTHQGTTLERVLDWASQLHGYLSTPTGGGVRHGIDLTDGKPISLSDGRLFCNLIRSYIVFLLSEHERLIDSGAGDA